MKIIVKNYVDAVYELYAELDDDMEYPDYYRCADWMIEDIDTGETFSNETYAEYGNVFDNKAAVTNIDDFKVWLETQTEFLNQEYGSASKVWKYWDRIVGSSPYHKDHPKDMFDF